MNQFPMTLEGAKKLKKELEYLKNIERPKITKAISEARSHGDLKENAEYHAAREQQSFCEGRIKEIESKLSYAQIIDITKITPSKKVVFGSTVSLINLKTKSKISYKIVGEDEADLKKKLISISSPIARGLVGKKEKEIAYIDTPRGIAKYKILKVQYI
ncbi:transcription elongation factor GreA [bacterium endosymbiont of Pedicinus badii]|uniref:transcription elongation factor GreA n=1 Tax=bacterium endosymbiont of Pedicinus badii TaxID=1719126 RepID=UPI0009B950A1|nr:transcription elongation factor GreA [bacterium endosymbiont of Pedicinus badii]OQM34187.1 transcription elongation factor GreA [bacterium endosymbiont of Pedicinus badii]